jgi:hypothetical protein
MQIVLDIKCSLLIISKYIGGIVKITLFLKIAFILTALIIVSCVQQDKNIILSDIVVIKYKSNENDLSRADLLYHELKQEFFKAKIIIDELEVSKSYKLEDTVLQQVKDYKRSYVFLFTKYELSKLNLIALQNPKTMFIVFDDKSQEEKNLEVAENIKRIAINSSNTISNLAYVSAYWANNKESQSGKIAYLYDNNSDYSRYEKSFEKGVENFNKDYGKNVEIIKEDIAKRISQRQLDDAFDNMIKQNAVVYFIATEKDYFRILKKVQTMRKYACGIQTDMYYHKPEYQDTVLISEDISFKQIANDIVTAIDTGQLVLLNNLYSATGKYVKLSTFHNFDNSFSNNIKNFIMLASF